MAVIQHYNVPYTPSRSEKLPPRALTVPGRLVSGANASVAEASPTLCLRAIQCVRAIFGGILPTRAIKSTVNWPAKISEVRQRQTLGDVLSTECRGSAFDDVWLPTPGPRLLSELVHLA